MPLNYKKDLSVLGVDIGGTSIKLVDLRAAEEKLHLTTYAELMLGTYAGHEPGEVVKLGFQKLQTALRDIYVGSKTSCKNIVVSIPMSDCKIFHMILPKEADGMLDTIVPMELRKFTTISSSLLSVSYEKLPKSFSRNETDINLVVLAVRENSIIETRQMLEEIIEADNLLLEPSIFGAIRSANVAKEGMSLIVDLGASMTSVACLIDGVLLDVTTITKGMQEITVNLKNSLLLDFYHAESLKKSYVFSDETKDELASDIIKVALGHIIEEVIHIRSRYEMRYNIKCENVWLVGGGSRLHKIRDFFKNELKCNVFIPYPFDKVVVPDTMANLLKGESPTFANAAGLSLSQLI